MNECRNRYENTKLGNKSRSLFLLEERYDLAINSPNAIGIHMKHVKLTSDVKQFLKEHAKELNVKFNSNGEIQEQTCYYLTPKKTIENASEQQSLIPI